MRGMTTGSAFAPHDFSMKSSKSGTKNDIRLTRLTRHKRLIFFAALAAMAQPLCAQTLKPEPPVELTGTHGKFDFIKVDESRRRLLACHTGNGSLDVIDETNSKLIKSIPTGAAQGVAIDDKGGRYFVSCSKPPQMVIVDANKLEATGTVTLPGPADLCAYCGGVDDCVYVDSDEKAEMWTIDVKAEKVADIKSFSSGDREDIASGPFTLLKKPKIEEQGGMEDVASSPVCLLQNLKNTNELVTIQLIFAGGRNLRPTAKHSTLPAEKPHGLAVVDVDKVLVAGGNGKLVLLNYDYYGKVIASAAIAPRVDEIAYDPGLGKAYCASGTGVISVVSVGKETLGMAENIPSAQGAHSIAVDSKTHAVWIVFAKGDKAYVQSFIAGKI